MSHTLYDPFATEDQSPTQEQYGLSNKPIERDSRGASSHLGPGSSFSSSGPSSAPPANSGGIPPSLPPQWINYGTEQNRTIIGQNTEMSLDMQSIPGLGGIDCQAQDKPATPTESSQPKGTSKSATDILLHFGLDEEDLDHLIFYPEDQITPANLPFILQEIRTGKTKRAASAVQTVPFAEPHPPTSVSGMHGQSLSSPGGAAKSIPPASNFPSSTDVMHPVPVQMLPPSNRQPLANVSPVSRDQPTASMLQDHPSATSSFCSYGGTGMCPKEWSPVDLQLSKVTDYGYNSKYSEGLWDETASTNSSRADSGGSGSMSLMNTPTSSRHSRESVQKNVRELKSILLGFSRDHTISVSTLCSSHSSILSSVDHSSNDWTTQLPTQPYQTSQSILSSLAVPKKDTDTHVLKSTTPKPEGGCQSTLKTQPLLPCVNPSQSGFVIVDKNDASVAKDHSEIKGQESVAETIIKQQQKQPVSLTGQTVCPPASDSPNITDTMQPVPIQPPAKLSPFSKVVPIGLKLQDYAAATPRSFPHTCSLCNKECIHMKDWISHLSTSLHHENCQVLQKEAPGRRERGSKEKRSSRSRSPQSSRCNRRSRSCSSSSGSSSSSLERQSSQRRRDEKRSSPRRGNDRQSSPRRSSERRSPPRRIGKRRSPPRRTEKRRSPPRRIEKRRSPTWRSEKRRSPPWRSEKRRSPPWRSEKRRTPPRRSDERQSSPWRSEKRRCHPKTSDEKRSPPRRSDEKQSPPRRGEERQSPPRRGEEKQSPPSRSEERQSPPRRGEERQSPPRTNDQRPSIQEKKSNTAEILAKELLQSSAVQSPSTQSKLQNVAKLLAPAILAEITKLESSASSSSSAASSSSFSFAAKKKKFTKKLPKAKPTLQTSEASPSTKAKCGKSSPPTMVKLQGIESSVSLSDVLEAVENYGKTKSCLLFRSTQGAVVCFEREEDAKKLKSVNSFDVKDTTITVVKEQDTVSKEQQRPLQNKSSMSSVSTLLPQSNMHLSKNTNVLTKQMTSESTVQEVGPKDTAKVVEKTSVTAFEPKLQADHDKANNAELTEPMGIGEMGVDVSEQVEDGNFAEIQEEKTTTSEVVPENPSSLTSLKQHLQDSSEITINFEPNTISVKAKPQTVKSQTQPPPARLLGDGSQHSQQTSGPGESAISEPITAGPSATDTSDVVMKEEDEKPGTEATMDSTDGPEANEDVEKAEVKAAEGSLTTSISSADVTSTSAVSCENKVPAPTSPAPSATISVTAKPAAVKSETQPPSSELSENGSQPSLQTSGPGESTISEPITAGVSATDTSGVVMEEDEKPGTESTMDSTDGPEANKVVEKAEVKAEEGSLTTSIPNTDETSTSAISCESKVPAPTSPAPSATVKSETQPPPSELSENGSQPSLQTSGPGGSTISEPVTAGGSVNMASDEEDDEGCLFDEKNFNMDDFITIDEVGDVEEPPEPHNSSSSQESSGEQREKQSSGLSSTGKGTSTNTEKDSETASSLSNLTKGSRSSQSSSVSPKTTESEAKIGTSSAVHLLQQGPGLKPDSVKDETARDEPTVMTRSTRAKRERTTQQDASNEKTKTVGMSTRRSTRAGEAEEQKKEKTPKKEEKTPQKRSTPSKKSDRVLREISKEGATCDVFDSMKDGVVPNDLPATRRKRGRPRKVVKRTRKDSATLKNDDQDASEKLADEEATYQITDSVDDKLVGDQQSEEKKSKNSDQQTKKSASLKSELQALVTLDPFVEKEDRKSKESMLETHPTSQPNTETLLTLDEPGDEEEKQTAKIPKSGKRKHDDDTVGKPTRGENVTAKDEREDEREPACTGVLPSTPLDASSSLDTGPSLLSSVSHPEIQKTEVEVGAVSQANSDAASENQTPEEGEEGMERWSQAYNKDYREAVGPEAKRSRSQSPCAAGSRGALDFQPNNDDLHCSIQSHSHDLQPCDPESRIQLYDVTRKRLHDNDMADPNNWGKIAMIRPGRVPVHSPYLSMNTRTATDIKAWSKLVTCFAVETPDKPAAFSDARVTIYDHVEGPWAEVEEINKAEGPRLMAYLVAPPHDTHLVVPRGYYRTVAKPIKKRQNIRDRRGRKKRKLILLKLKV